MQGAGGWGGGGGGVSGVKWGGGSVPRVMWHVAGTIRRARGWGGGGGPPPSHGNCLSLDVVCPPCLFSSCLLTLLVFVLLSSHWERTSGRSLMKFNNNHFCQLKNQ